MRYLLAIALLGKLHSLGAQEMHGSIRGSVKGQDGRALGEVDVMATSSHLLGARVTRTGIGGDFRIALLPPGIYALRFRRLGMQAVVVDSVIVHLGRTTQLPVLALADRATQLDEVRVVSNAILLDPVHTDGGATLGSDEYASLPGERDYRSLITVLPHANAGERGDAVNVAGATGLENMYFIDGVNVTAPLKGEAGTNLPYNFVRSVEVKTGGYEAEYGHALGAVVNAVTYSGGNEFEVALFGFGTGSALAASPKAEPTLREHGSTSFDVGVRVGGPIKRDRLWYSAAYNPRREVVSREIAGFGVFDDHRTTQVFAGKLTLRANATHGLELSAFGDPSRRRAVAVNAFGSQFAPAPGSIDPFLTLHETGGVAVSLRTTSLWSRFAISTSLSRASTRANQQPDTEIGRTEPLFINLTAPSISGGGGVFSLADETRSQATTHASGAVANHSLKVGAEFELVEVTRTQALSGGYRIVRPNTSVYVTVAESGNGKLQNRVPTIFAQDSWQLTDRLTLNAGLRWSSQTLYGASGGIAQRFRNEWQPRVGIVWQPGALGGQRFFASAGRFYQQQPLNISTFYYLDYAFVRTGYASDPRQPGATPTFVSDESTKEADWARNDPEVELEHSDEMTVGYDRAVKGSRIGLRLVHRNLRAAFQQSYNPETEVWVLGTPGKGDLAYLPDAKRSYTAAELSSEGEWQLARYRASYVVSRNSGNYTGFFSGDNGTAFPGGNYLFSTPEHAVNSLGLLPNDRTHVLKISASRQIVSQVELGTLITWQSGAPLNVLGASLYGAPTAGAPPILLVPRGSAGRLPTTWDLNTRVTWTLHSRESLQSRLLFDLLHLGNPQRPVWVSELQYLSNVGGVQSNPSPAYGKVLSYQRPFAAQLGLELSFR